MSLRQLNINCFRFFLGFSYAKSEQVWLSMTLSPLFVFQNMLVEQTACQLNSPWYYFCDTVNSTGLVTSAPFIECGSI